MDGRGAAHIGDVGLRERGFEPVRIAQTDHFQAAPDFGEDMPDALGCRQLLQLHDPLAMHRRVEQGGEPQEAGKMRFFLHNLCDRRMRNLRDLHRAYAVYVVVEPLQGKTVQVHKVARYVKADSIAAIFAFQGPQHEAFNEHRRAIANIAARDKAVPVFEGLDLAGQGFELCLLGLAHVLSQASYQKVTGLRVTCEFA